MNDTLILQPPKRESHCSFPWKVAIPEEMGLKSCAEDIELTESFHDRVGVQDSLLDPLCNLVALPGCG